ncbi:MAG: TIM barrel protein [Acidilobaceae archaeon]|nr:TIM barrel protein [Acidilobaceae archaeon]MDW7974352.1 TIM barrel protein [Sulfolobales archaeon]
MRRSWRWGGLRLRFGPAGVPLDYKGAIEGVPQYLRSIGLDAMEYEAVHGVKISEARARRLGEEAERNDVVMSLHAPYYINLASKERDVFERSIQRVVESLLAAEWMGAEAVVIHSGYYKGHASREDALKRVIDGYREALSRVDVRRAKISPEIMGKASQVGTVEEAVEICRNVGRCKPCIDWAHLYARAEGKYVITQEDVIKVLEYLERELGREAVSPIHSHFSKIKYGRGGEREHLTLSQQGGPEWAIVCKTYLELGYSAVTISESPILDKDALVMKGICEEIKIKGFKG